MRYSILTIALISTSVLAVDNTATGPNKVYIEQLGNTNTITIEQVGGTNNVGGINGTTSVSNSDHLTTHTPDAPSSLNYATVSGNTNVLSLTQTGNNNSAQYNIKGNQNTYTSTVTVSLRSVSVTTGEILTSVTITKTVLSYMDKFGVLRFTSADTKAIEAEIGGSINESINRATNKAIQAAVLETIREGARKGHWSYKENDKSTKESKQ